jgi:biotin carboxyl carrier protein
MRLPDEGEAGLAPTIPSGSRRMRMTEVKAELVGNVWKVEAAAGDRVEEDDILLILESMKMEIPVTSPVAGTVREIRVKEQEVVKEGQVLAIIE